LREEFPNLRRGYRSLKIVGIANPYGMIFERDIRKWVIVGQKAPGGSDPPGL
jgi:hypothetical protein